jgi:hypothetical protein
MMDPILFSTTFATIVGLIGQFRSERGSSEQANFNEFSTWLSTQQHQDVVELLKQNQSAVKDIDALLHEQQDGLSKKLEHLDRTFASIASMIPGFTGIAEAVRPQARLSPQAIGILQQFERSGASKVLKLVSFGGTELIYIGAQGAMEIEDERFLEDDLATLVELNLVHHDYNDSGGDLYLYTRAASDLVRTANPVSES